jgi:acetylornithine deacetylase/succinyl-diaminopimelate desuccinylase-like protein
MQVDLRIPPGETSEGLEKRVQAIINGYAGRNPRVKVTYNKIDYSEPYLSPSGNLLVKAFTSAIMRVRGSRTQLLSKTGSGDMNIFGTVTGIPCVTYGPGDNHFDHRPDEQIRLQDYLDGIEILTETLRRLQVLYEKRSKMCRVTGENAEL